MAKYQVIIGRSEQIDFVNTAIGVAAKVDTGAYRSSVHATHIVVKDGVLTANLFGHPTIPVKRTISTEQYDTVSVRSSNGQEETRYEIKLKIKLGNKIFNTSFSLADRSYNLYPVLIGRKALRRRFMVDVDRSSVNKQQMLRAFGITAPRDEEDED